MDILEEVGSEDDAQCHGTHLVLVFMVCHHYEEVNEELEQIVVHLGKFINHCLQVGYQTGIVACITCKH